MGRSLPVVQQHWFDCVAHLSQVVDHNQDGESVIESYSPGPGLICTQGDRFCSTMNGIVLMSSMIDDRTPFSPDVGHLVLPAIETGFTHTSTAFFHPFSNHPRPDSGIV